MSALNREPQADPLYARPMPERPAYATGMLLGARDFVAEQTYHRGRLARALAQLAGNGTLAGLEVLHQPPVDGGGNAQVEEIRVDPGVAVDRLGRMIEITRPACLRLAPWFVAEQQRDGGSTLLQGSYATPGQFVSQRRRTRLRAGEPGMPARAVVADLYLRFVACETALSPAFASGPYDALDAVATSRLRDAYELKLVVRKNLTPANPGWPSLGPDLAAQAPDGGTPGDPLQARRDALQDQVLRAYPAGGRAGTTNDLEPLPEHPQDMDDTSSVYLARVLVPVGAANPPARSGSAVVVDNWSRRFLPSGDLLARWIDAARI